MSDVASRLEAVEQKIARACEQCGRDSGEVTLVAVSKTRPTDDIATAFAAGARHFGENYVQETVAKHEQLGDLEASGLQWHFIGHLQTNKVRQVVPWCSLIHTVDSLRLAEEINRRAELSGCRAAILLQVDLAGEETKYGCPEAELAQLAAGVANLPHVQWQGLMTIPPACEQPEQARPYFQRLVQWQRQLLDQGYSAAQLRHLSMGMSHDFEVAIAEGATLVRVGTAVFGPRPPH